MPDGPQFETLDLSAIEHDLRIEIGPGAGCIGEDPTPDTDIYAKPLGVSQFAIVRQTLGSDSELAKQLVSGSIEPVGLKFTVDGKPNQEHIDLGIELAQEIIKLKGLRGAIVVAEVDEELQQHLVLANT